MNNILDSLLCYRERKKQRKIESHKIVLRESRLNDFESYFSSCDPSVLGNKLRILGMDLQIRKGKNDTEQTCTHTAGRRRYDSHKTGWQMVSDEILDLFL